MAKGAYSFIAYPESADIDDVTGLLEKYGAEWSYILHDKDVWLEDHEEHKKGDSKKPHWHIVAGWETGLPNWKQFKQICNDCGAVAISYNTCFVQDCEGCTNYFTHPDNPEKYQYPLSAVVSSPDFDCDAYQLADTRRNKKRQRGKIDKLCNFQSILIYIEENQIDTWAKLLKSVSQDSPEYLETCLQYAYGLQSYINTRKFGIPIDELNRNYQTLQSDYQLVSKANQKLKDQVQILQKENTNLRKYIMQVASECGENGKQHFWEGYAPHTDDSLSEFIELEE